MNLDYEPLVRRLPYGVGKAIVLVLGREDEDDPPEDIVRILDRAEEYLTDALDNYVEYRITRDIHDAAKDLVLNERDATVAQFLWSLMRYNSNSYMTRGIPDIDLARECVRVLRDKYSQPTGQGRLI